MSFADGSDDELEAEEIKEEVFKPNEEMAKQKLAQQFWATPTSEALRLRAPASGRTLSSQRIANKPVDDLAFGIPQERLHGNTGESGAAGAATVNTFLRPMARPGAREDALFETKPACGHRSCIGLGFCISDDGPAKPTNKPTEAWASAGSGKKTQAVAYCR
jgi:hypothetical protein